MLGVLRGVFCGVMVRGGEGLISTVRWYTGQTAFWDWDLVGLWCIGNGCWVLSLCFDGLIFPVVGFWKVGPL